MVTKTQLTEQSISSLQIEPGKTLRKVSDESCRGLSLLIDKNGKSWRFRYYVDRQERLTSFGKWPDVTLAAARAKATNYRAQIEGGADPLRAKVQGKIAAAVDAENTFAKIAGELLELQDDKSPKTKQKHEWLMRLVKRLHAVPVSQLTAPKVLELVRTFEAENKRETAHRVAWFVSRVIRHAVQTGRILHNPVGDLRGALKPIKAESRAAITDPQEVGALLRLIEHGPSHLTVKRALTMLAHVFVRPGKEFLWSEWSEFDLDGALWKIPASRMKMGRPHVVPLSTQVVEILKAQKALSGEGKYVWPSGRTDDRPISNGAFSAALSALFYDSDQHTPHGFRSTASTLLNELGFDSSIIELQLAHARKDAVAAIYDRSQKLPERRVMMQAWSDYLDKLKAGKG